MLSDRLNSPVARWLALGLGIGALLAAWSDSNRQALEVARAMAWPLALVWAGKHLAYYRGWAGYGQITADSPGSWLQLLGWLWLVLIAAGQLYQRFAAGL